MSRCYTRWVHHGEDYNVVGEDGEQYNVVGEDGQQYNVAGEDGDFLDDVDEQYMSWHVNEEAPLPDEVQDEDVLDDGARGSRVDSRFL
jgi:hypothetical protein